MKTLPHAIGVVAAAAAVCLLYLQPPGLGDDFTYWKLAFELRDGVPGAWSEKSFHALRWPVWGVIWLLQGLGVHGLLSYYGVPFFYLSAGALFSFFLARQVIGSAGAGWIATLAYLLHPLLDTVVYRPMPDLSEGVLGAAIVTAWMAAMRAERNGVRVAWCALVGLLAAIIHANRFTGVLIFPALGLLTLLFFPRRFGWLLVCGAFAACFVAIESYVYWQMTGDWLHSLHANMGARGRKGTESVPLYTLPFRFVDTLFKGNRHSLVFMLAAILGGWQLWRGEKNGTGRIVVAWAIVLYLGYSCAIQGVNPVRPMLRDAVRFLGSIAIPLSVLIAAGILSAVSLARSARPAWLRSLGEKIAARPGLAGALAFVLILALSSRARFDAGSIPAFRDYLATTAAGTRVFTDRATRAFAFLMHPQAARSLDWSHRSKILERDEELERMAAAADEFWYMRKLIWQRHRKEMLYQEKEDPQALASYFDQPEKDWRLVRVLSVQDNPEFVFHRRRRAGDPPARIFTAQELPAIAPRLPVAWDGKTSRMNLAWPVHEAWRGRPIRLEIVSQSNYVQPYWAKADFFDAAGRHLDRVEIKTHVYPTPAKDFMAFEVPAAAERCVVDCQIEKGVKRLEVLDFRIVVD